MGQYQEWLLAQEVDRRLKTEIEALETEILYLKDRITILEQAVPETENVILQALLAYQQESTDQTKTAPTQASWSGLPRVETPRPASGPIPSFASVYAQSGRLSGDMLAFFEEHRQAEPGLSSRLRGEQETGNQERSTDAETQRLNENIQRWFTRWHREITDMAQTEEVGNGE